MGTPRTLLRSLPRHQPLLETLFAQGPGTDRLLGIAHDCAIRPAHGHRPHEASPGDLRSGAEPQHRHVAPRLAGSTTLGPWTLRRDALCSSREGGRGHLSTPSVPAEWALHRTLSGEATGQQVLDSALKKLVYRAQQRGILELDLLVGKWAQQRLASLSPTEVKDLAALLDEESPDLLKWLLGQDAPPDHVASNTVFKALRTEVEGRLTAHTNPSTCAQPGADWVKGWGDIGRPGPTFVPAPPSGNQ